MSTKAFFDLTIDELNAIGAEAGAEAVRKAHAAGLAVSGMTRIKFASGTEIDVVTWLHPDGLLEIADKTIDVKFLDRDAPFVAEDTDLNSGGVFQRYYNNNAPALQSGQHTPSIEQTFQKRART
jgi:hypothetical protein